MRIMNSISRSTLLGATVMLCTLLEAQPYYYNALDITVPSDSIYGGFTSTTGGGLNDYGQVAGAAITYSLNGGYNYHAFIRDAGGHRTFLDAAFGGISYGLAINNLGQMAGSYGAE